VWRDSDGLADQGRGAVPWRRACLTPLRNVITRPEIALVCAAEKSLFRPEKRDIPYDPSTSWPGATLPQQYACFKCIHDRATKDFFLVALFLPEPRASAIAAGTGVVWTGYPRKSPMSLLGPRTSI